MEKNVSTFRVTEIVLMQCNVVDKNLNYNIFLLIFISIKVEPINLVILKAYKTEFYKPDITLTDQNGQQVEIRLKFNSTLAINK